MRRKNTRLVLSIKWNWENIHVKPPSFPGPMILGNNMGTEEGKAKRKETQEDRENNSKRVKKQTYHLDGLDVILGVT